MVRSTGVLAALLGAALVIPTGQLVASEPPMPSPVPPGLSTIGENDGSDVERTFIDPALAGLSGSQRVFVELTGTSLAEGGSLARLDAQQDAMLDAVGDDISLIEIGRVSRVLNGVFVVVDAADVQRLALDDRVASVVLVRDYALDLAETVPYIGATTVHGRGVDGSGVVVAVIDSGVDYTHAALGGAGTVGAYTAAAGTSEASTPAVTRDTQFPSAKVIEGWDYTGQWTGQPGGPTETQDPDPIDRQGHGTHVADIIAGRSGVAPGASIYALRACSATTSACSGIAMVQSIERAVDPNQDGDTADHVDIINMSLGSWYGSAYDDVSANAVEAATGLGVLTVASSGNSADKPFVTGTPAAAPSALSVAETTVPSGYLNALSYGTTPTATTVVGQRQPWSPAPSAVVTGAVQYGNVGGGNLDGCSAYPAGSLTNKILLVDRGTCVFSVKAANATAAGAQAVVVALLNEDLPFASSAGDRAAEVHVPAYLITRAAGQTMKDQIGQTLRIDPAATVPTVGSVVGTSSRGPSLNDVLIKPEIGAPGGSVSAVVGTGTGVSAFGGTSGAAPMIAGSAALLLDSYPSRTPNEIKAVLMNTADPTVMNRIAEFGGTTAEISRVGNGEVRVDAAHQSTIAAWDKDRPSGSLSFGFREVGGPMTLQRTVVVRNYADTRRTYDLAVEFRDPTDQARGAVTVTVPASVTVPAKGQTTFVVTMTIDPHLLEAWTGNSGSRGIDPVWLTRLEYDGWIQLTQRGTSTQAAHLAWHVLPRRASSVSVAAPSSMRTGPVAGATLTNAASGGPASLSVFALVGTSPDVPLGPAGGEAPVGDLAALGYRVIGGQAAQCGADSDTVVQFALALWEPVTHASAPFSWQVLIDLDDDGEAEAYVYTDPWDRSADARSVTVVHDAVRDVYQYDWWTDHDIASRVAVLSACVDALGLTDDTLGTVEVAARTVDWWDRNWVTTDEIPWTRIDMARARHGLTVGGTAVTTIPLLAGAAQQVLVAEDGSSDSVDVGVLLLQRRGAAGGKEYFTLSDPGRPTGLTGTPSNGRVALRWTAPAPGDAPVLGYRIESRDGSGSWTVAVADTGSATSSRTMTGLVNGHSYRFRVSARTMTGWGAVSSISAPVVPYTTPAQPPRAPRGIVGGRSVTLSWSEPPSNGRPITGYRIQKRSIVDGRPGSWTTAVANTGSPQNSRKVTGLVNGRSYQFRVAAINLAGAGTWSDASARLVPGASR
jgi:subtilisin family serine protease